jgi:hypothetical protein
VTPVVGVYRHAVCFVLVRLAGTRSEDVFIFNLLFKRHLNVLLSMQYAKIIKAVPHTPCRS